jgi:DNA (cytosine-5)-methyltransferase 1
MGPGERDHFTRINKLDLTKPSYTIIVGSDKGGGKGHIHPISPREVTPRESARMQTFPDWWTFKGNGRHAIRQIGNAVPPLLAFAVGNAVRTQLFGLKEKPLSHAIKLLGQEHLFPKITK